MTETLGFCQETRPEDCGFILFGATGDLAGRKILPALFRLCEKKLAPKNFYLLLAGRTPLDRPALESRVWAALNAAGVSPSQEHFGPFLSRLEYLRADYGSEEFYSLLERRLTELDARHKAGGRRLFYLATPPSAYRPIAAGLKAAGLLSGPAACGRWSRLILEKPYGESLEDALRLPEELGEGAEDRLYRIDHFTGKEAVQNILALRAANAVFDGTWNASFVDHVQITVLEELGVAGRAAFFERTGLARDMMSHLLQLAAVTAMDLPASFRDAEIREEKRRFFSAIRPYSPAEAAELAVRGQYDGYRLEPGVAAGSAAETFLAFRLSVDNDRWRGVPFYIRAGKKAGLKRTCIDLVYKKPRQGIFSRMELGAHNVFSFAIQPEPKVSFSVVGKHPGPKLCFEPQAMQLDYRPGAAADSPTDYERLLLDAMAGDQTLFLGRDETRFLWDFLAPLLKAWSGASPAPLHIYPDGTPGPAAADALPEREGRRWL